MSEDTDTQDETPKKASRAPLLVGAVLALLGGGGGYYATSAGMILAPSEAETHAKKESVPKALPDISFVELEPLVVSISGNEALSHLRFRAHLEVPSTYKSDVELLEPRIIDVLNSYLRALRTSDIEDTSALARLRAQMLRRVQVVIGPDRVKDLLIMEFVIN